MDRAAGRGKPVVVLKVGKNERTRAAIATHTGGLAGDARVFSEVLRARRAADRREIDLNPIKVPPQGRGCSIVDALIVPAQRQGDGT